MTKDTQLAQLDREEKQAKYDKGMAESLERLYSNRDFKRLVLDGYFKDEAVRLVQLKATPSMQNPQSQASIIQQIDAIGSFQQFLTIVGQQGNLAERFLDSVEDTRSFITSEDE